MVSVEVPLGKIVESNVSLGVVRGLAEAAATRLPE